MKMNRRKFVVSAAAVAGAPALQTGNGGPLGANDRVICAFVGTGGMGRSNMRDFLRSGQVRAAAVCDVWDHNRDLTLQMTAEQEGGKASGYKDFRRVLDLKEVDVVVVSTPDHWHALPTVMACDAGKDVYVEKPLSLTIHEGRKMVEAARRNERIVQMGTQQRSGEHFQEAVKLVREGAIGKVSRVHTWNFGNESPAGMGRPQDTEPPPGLDWDFWLGPAPKAPFNGNRFIHTFRWFWDYSGGMLTDWGTHHLDIVQWAMQVDAPLAATAVGGNFCIDDNRETPDTLEVLYEYPGFIASFSHRVGNARGPAGRGYGIEFFGTDGTLYLNRGGFEIRPETGGNSSRPAAPLPEDAGSENARPPQAGMEFRERKIRIRDGSGLRPALHPCPELPGLRAQPEEARLGRGDRPPFHHDPPSREHRTPDGTADSVGRREGTGAG